MEQLSFITGWIRVAVAGETVDRRTIDPTHIEQMGKNYDPELYTALIWVEHLRSLFPDGAFKSVGRVVATKAEQITSGTMKGLTALYVKLAPAPELLQLVRSGQKLFTSVEINPRMPVVKGAYLMGLAVTDSPASIGTSLLKFSKNHEHLYSSSLAEPLRLRAEFL
jgi:hypothetical protein